MPDRANGSWLAGASCRVRATCSTLARRCLLPAVCLFPARGSSAPGPANANIVVYLDSSALVKLVVAESESAALRRYLRAEPRRASCALAKVEVLRAVRLHGAAAMMRARRLLRRVDLVALDDELLDSAAVLDAGILRSLDAIHLAAAQTLAEELTAVVTYDERMTTAAGLLGLVVAAPR